MRSRFAVALLVLVVPLLTLAVAGGCGREKKVKRYEQTEERRESEPVMVSPGHEVLE